MRKARTTRVAPRTLTEKDLHALERKTFRYFWSETNPQNGLLPDSTLGNVPASIAGVGMALAAYPVGVERRFTSRHSAIQRVLATLRFFTTANKGLTRLPRVTAVFIITFSTYARAVAPGSVSSPRSTRRFCSLAR